VPGRLPALPAKHPGNDPGPDVSGAKRLVAAGAHQLSMLCALPTTQDGRLSLIALSLVILMPHVLFPPAPLLIPVRAAACQRRGITGSGKHQANEQADNEGNQGDDDNDGGINHDHIETP